MKTDLNFLFRFFQKLKLKVRKIIFNTFLVRKIWMWFLSLAGSYKFYPHVSLTKSNPFSPGKILPIS